MGKRKVEFLDEEFDAMESFSTKFKTETIRISWTIQNYNMVSQTIKLLESPKFPSSSNNPAILTRQWYLEFEPKPISDDSSESFEITLKPTIPGEVHVQASLFFKTLTSEKYNWGGYKKILPTGNFIFWKANVSRLTKILKWDEASSNDLIIICDVRTIDPTQEITKKIKNSCIEKPETENIMGDISVILSQQLYTDVTFLIGDKKLHAHKTILAARSPIFAQMFYNQIEETEKKDCSIVEIENTSLEVFEIVLNFVYTGKVNNLEGLAQKVFVAAEKYGLQNLKNICLGFLSSNICENNIFEIIRFAFKEKVKNLQKEATEFLRKNFVNLQKLANFQKLSATSTHLVPDLLEIISKMKPQEEEEEMAETGFEFR